MPDWFSYAELACVAAAGGVWYAFPQAGPWPLILVLAPWGGRFLLTGQLTRRTPFDLPLAIFLLTAGLGVWAAYDRQAAWSKFWLIVGGVFLFYALVNAEPIGTARAWFLAFFGAVVSLYFLATHDWDAYPAKIDALTRLGRALQAPLPVLPGHRLHPNVAGGIMAMMLPFSGLVTVQTWREAGLRRAVPRSPAQSRWSCIGDGPASGMVLHRGPGRHAPRSFTAARGLALAGGLGAFALTSFGLLLTTSRGAWIALAGALLLAGLWLVSGFLGRGSAERTGWIFPGLLLLLLAVALAVGLAWPQGIAALASAVPGPNTSLDRMELLRATLTLVRDYPIVGAGLGGFQMLYSTYVLLIHVGYSVHSHNLFLNVAVEQGLPALLALIWMWLLFAAAVWWGVFRSGSRCGAGMLGVAALSLVVLLLHGLVDDVLYGSRAILLLFVPLAFAVPALQSAWRSMAIPGAQRSATASEAVPLRTGQVGAVPDRHRSVRSPAVLLVPVGLALLMALALIWREAVLSLLYSNLGAVRQSQTELSVYSWPEWPIQDEVRRAVDLGQPVAEYERALALSPRNSTANRRLGMIELSLGEYEDALRHLAVAAAAEPRSETTRQLYGEALIVNGRLQEGKAQWAGVSNEQGQLSARVFWYQHIGDAERAEWVRQAANDR